MSNSRYRLTASRTCSAYKTNVREFLVRLNKFPFPGSTAGPAGGGTRSASQLLSGCLSITCEPLLHATLTSPIVYSGALPAHRTSVVPPDSAAIHRELKIKNALPIISVPVNRLDRPRLIGRLFLRSRNIYIATSVKTRKI
jgi:hypothetical protein